MGFDVASLLVNQTSSNNKGKSVIFTFCGPQGLIEGGSNQKISLIVDVDSLSKV